MRQTFLPYCRPSIGDAEVRAAMTCCQNGWLTTGARAHEFEEAFTARAGVQYAVALNSCTAALHLGLLAMGVGPGDEVIMPSLTFVAGAQCAREIGANPIFADIDPRSLCVTAATIEPVLSGRTRVIIPMHYGGQPSEIADIVRLARRHGVRVLEDAAHAVGMLDQGHWSGSVSDGAAYSFYPTKNITTGEGGMFVTNDRAMMERVRILSLHGMNRDAWKRYSARESWRYDVVEPGYKYNLTDIAAAIGIVQLQRLEELQVRRESIARTYIAALAEIAGIVPVASVIERPNRHSWCMFVVRVNEAESGMSRDELIEALRKRNIGTSVHYIPTHQFSGYRQLVTNLPHTDAVWPSLLSLPLYPDMTEQDVHDVVDAVRDAVPADCKKRL